MKANSQTVSSSQRAVHQNLRALVRRHLEHKYRKPCNATSLTAFSRLQTALNDHHGPIILDSFCGTGQSTKILAERHPNHFVVGVDKSAHRLNKHNIITANDPTGANYQLLQANCEDIWQLMLENDIQPEYHFLLYPNPWPKPGHLQRRIHGNGSFSRLLELGGTIELRSNWKLYIEEFDIAMQMAGRSGQLTGLSQQPPLTLFEQKYRDSGHPLWSYLSESQN